MYRTLIFKILVIYFVTLERVVAANSTEAPKNEALFGNTEKCSLTITDPKFAKKFQQIVTHGDKLIYINFTLVNGTNHVLSGVDPNIFRPLNMLRIRGRSGQGLVWLKDQFIVLSLNSLKYGVANLNIPLMETPIGCLSNKTFAEFESELMHYIMNDFTLKQSVESTWASNELLCNRRIRDVNGFAEFYYHCCNVNEEKGDTECRELTRDPWVTVLFVCILILSISVIMNVPRMVPSHLYRKSYGTVSYEYAFDEPLKVNILKTKNKPDAPLKNAVNMTSLKEMPNFYHTVKQMADGQSYEMKLDKINIKIRRGKLIPGNFVPVGILRSFYESIILCGIRHKPSLKGCCTSSMFGTLFDGRLLWNKCLRKMMKFVVFFLILLPWGIRVLVFVVYEKGTTQEQQNAASNRNLTMVFPGSLTLMLTPLHVVFILCYSFIAIDALVLGILSKEVTEKFKYVFRKCFRDMRHQSQSQAIGWAAKVMLKPLEKCGLLGFVIGPLYWLFALPFVCLLLALYLFPMVNLTMRLLVHLIAHLIPNRKTQDSRKNGACSRLIQFLDLDFLTKNETIEKPKVMSLQKRSMQLLVITLCLISIYAVIVLIAECLTFFVEIIIYTLTGIILNATATMRYVSVMFMLVLYARDCFGTVTERYMLFNKAIMSVLMRMAKSDVEKVSWQTSDTQKKTAFQIDANISDGGGNIVVRLCEKSVPKIVVKNSLLKWEVDRLILFLDEFDTPYITYRFFFDSIEMPCCGCPGRLPKNLFAAVSKFMKIVVFLLFVTIVVYAFGEVNEVSGTNQTLATLAGGFLPFMFTKILFKGKPDLSIETDNIHFKSCLSHVIQNYRQAWPISDVCGNSKSAVINNQDETQDSSLTECMETDITSLDHIRLVPNDRLEYLRMEDYDVVIIDNRDKQKETTTDV